jgi:hypothetical protein
MDFKSFMVFNKKTIILHGLFGAVAKIDTFFIFFHTMYNTNPLLKSFQKIIQGFY